MKSALITGITGQDGSYLAELLLEKGYNVHGLVRRSSTDNLSRIRHLKDKITLIDGDLTDTHSLLRALLISKPDEVYNLAAQSFVQASFNQPDYTTQVTGIAVLNLLECIKKIDPERHIRFYQASSSEMFGKAMEIPQRETTPFNPRSPYGIAKQFAFFTAKLYRDAYGMFCCNGILFNHESPRRGEEFVTKKVARALAEIKKGVRSELRLGNLDSKRDWGYSKDYVEAMWLMLQQDSPDDYVIATNETHSIREFVEESCKCLGMSNFEWRGSGFDEKGYWNGMPIIHIDPQFFRPAEVDILLGDYTKAKIKLGWKPNTSFNELVKIMVDFELKELEKQGL
ncbi:MAG: GDP-mannose 4,6-dehydratase [Candidatus Nanoarchaeia archaeon]|nr:GDP-mannose 4,6-dehydratase [Candidatus Nanoarchaeia archaeon]